MKWGSNARGKGYYGCESIKKVHWILIDVKGEEQNGEQTTIMWIGMLSPA